MLRFWLAPVLFAVFFALEPQCADQYAPTVTPTALPDLLVDGVVAEFETASGSFSVFTTNEETIDELFMLQSGELTGVFPTGVLAPGSGAEDHNAPWSWHMHRQTVQLVKFAQQNCDRPLQQIEDNLADWLENIRRYCPRDAKLISVTDYR